MDTTSLMLYTIQSLILSFYLNIIICQHFKQLDNFKFDVSIQYTDSKLHIIFCPINLQYTPVMCPCLQTVLNTIKVVHSRFLSEHIKTMLGPQLPNVTCH